eukprot:scaffold66826_cov60-Cyclotella_meneghiniana.AAC.2
MDDGEVMGSGQHYSGSSKGGVEISSVCLWSHSRSAFKLSGSTSAEYGPRTGTTTSTHQLPALFDFKHEPGVIAPVFRFRELLSNAVKLGGPVNTVNC